MIKDLRETADDFISKNRHTINREYRLAYHVMGEIGWINDPNGFVYYGGKYHVFYQHNPFESVWGSMHWGHAVSDDLIHWKYLPIALAPDEDYDRDGCFSGSAIAVNDRLYIFYTGHLLDEPDQETPYTQQQCLAISDDGISFKKYSGNPIIRTGDIPEIANRRDFRDPKVTRMGDTYYMAIGSDDGAGNGQALLYISSDSINWTYQSVLAKSDGANGTNWECPDLFEMNGKYVLIISPQNMEPSCYQNISAPLYLLGDFNGYKGIMQDFIFGRMDYGFDFYAPQSMEDPSGRRIVIGWMNTWHQENPTHTLGHGWAGAMTLPREIVRVDDAIHFFPIREIEQYRQNEYVLLSRELEGEFILDTEGVHYELEVIVDIGFAKEFGIKLRLGQTEETVLCYQSAQSTVTLNRENSGIGPKGSATTDMVLKNGIFSCRLFVDTCSVEVFLNNGEKVMTALIYPGKDSKGIALFADSQVTIKSLRKWDLIVNSDDKKEYLKSISADVIA